MPETATSISYLPMLLVSVSHSAAPDDSSFDTPAAGQVDYLSHEWKEEDVWRSWRNMTRQKNAIANGIRLENASWRTWWKQRNKLKTISPETLNWCVLHIALLRFHLRYLLLSMQNRSMQGAQHPVCHCASVVGSYISALCFILVCFVSKCTHMSPLSQAEGFGCYMAVRASTSGFKLDTNIGTLLSGCASSAKNR